MMPNGYYAPFYRGGYFNTNPPAPQSFQPAPQQMPEVQYQAPFQQSAPVQNQSDLLWVLNESEATSYPVVPGATVTLWDKNDPVIYVKSVDAQGMPSMRILEFKERAPQSRGGQNAPGFVKVDEFNALRDELAVLSDKVRALTAENTAKEV